MLVLGRKKNQSIRIGDVVEVTVFASKGGRVKIGITAPPDVKITRAEMQEADALALASDWVAVGEDFLCVIDNRVKQLEPHGAELKEPKIRSLETSKR